MPPSLGMSIARSGWFRNTARVLVVLMCWQAMEAAWPHYARSLVTSPAGEGGRPPRATNPPTQLAFAGAMLADLRPAPATPPRQAAALNTAQSVTENSASASLAADTAADPTDPFVAAQAQALNHDANQIFAFVRDQVGYEAYSGSLRGARGTLWSKAGNALDRTSLLAALLRASGFMARYVQGTLSQVQARPLILSMFQARFRVLGCLPPGSAPADPANDAALLAVAQDHYWVEFSGSGSGPFTAADPSFPGAELGQVFGSPSTRFTDVPATLQHTVTFTIEAETFSQASAAFGVGNGISTTTVLSQTFATADLVGKPVTIGQFVNSQTLGSVLSATTNTYSPYLLVGQEASDPDTDLVIRGTDFQEAFTNFPLGSSVLTGLFVHVTVTNSRGIAQTFDKALFDRIGFAARNGSGVQISVDPGTGPSLGPNDLTTFNVLPALQDETIINAWAAVNDSTLVSLKALAGQITDSPAPSPEEIALRQQASALSLGLMINTQRVLTANFTRSSDILADRFATNWYVKAFLDSPRLVVASSRVTDSGNGTTGIHIGFDLLKDDVQVVLAPGQTPTAASAYRTDRGLMESHLEGLLLSSFAAAQSPVPGITVKLPVSATDILQQAVSQGIGTAVVASFNVSRLDTLDISAEAKARISQAVGAGRVVMVPDHAVSIDGVPRIGWLEVAVDGTVTGVLEDGSHGAIIEYTSVQVLQAALVIGERATISWFTGFFAGWTVGQLVSLVGFAISGFKVSPTGEQFLSIAATSFLDVLIKALVSSVPDVFFRAGFYVGLQAAQFGYLAAGAIDPPLPAALFGANPSPEFANLGSGASGGVAIDAIPDPLFTVPLDGAQLPTVFRVGIKNLTPATETFILDVSSVPAGFTAQTSLAQVEIPAGETGELSVCLQPVGDLPAPGTPASFSVRATSTTNAAITATASEPFTVPGIHGVALTSDPQTVGTTPGTPVSTTLTLEAVGNVPETVSLTATTPSGLSASSLGSVSLGVGETATRTLTLTPAAGIPLNTTLTVTVTATFGPAASPLIQTIHIPVAVVAPGAAAIADAAAAARQLGDVALAARLEDLSAALTELTQDPTSAVAKGRVLASLDALIALLANDPFTASFVTTLQFQRAALAQATAAGAIQVALGDLAGTMDGVDSILSGLARHGADVLLDPNSHVSVPNEPARFALVVRNTGTQTTTYDLSVQGLPASVTSQLSQSSVTLAPGQSSSQLAGGNLIVTLTQTSTTAIAPVDFSVRVTPQPAPDVARTVTGSLTVRAELVAVTAVTASPPFTAAGGLVDVVVRVLNVVNQPRDGSLSLVVRDPAGQPVLTLNQPLSLTLLSSLATVTFAGIDTTGFAPGSYTLEVSVKNAAGEPLPGATGQGTLLVGSPVTASLSVDPTLTPPGAPVVTATLRIDAQNTFASPFTVVGQLPGVGHSVALKDDIAYLCGANGIGIVDVSDATNPTLLSSFGSDRVSGSAFTVCKVDGDRLIVRTFPPPGYPFTLMVYSIATPTAPVFQGSTSVDFPVLNDLFVVGSTVFSTQTQFCFFFGSNDIFKQFGDLIAVDISDPTQPVLADVLFDTTPLTNFFGCFGRGGNSNTWQIAQADAQTLYVGASTATESDTTGIGRILVVDIGTPTNLSLVRELQVPGTTHVVGIATDGTRAIAVGSSGGWNDRGADLGLTGKLVVVTLDVSDPRNPQIVTTRTLDRASRGMHFVQSAGGGRFVTSSLGAEGDTPRVLVIDASDPANPFASQGDAPGDIPIFNVRNGLAYGASASGLFIFQLADAPGIPITAQVQIPKATGVSLVANSFNVAPDEIVTGPQFDTLIWNRGLAAGSTSFTFTWREQVANLQPGEARDVTLDSTVDFAVGSTPGHIPLPPATVSAAQILALAPPTRTANPNAPATYTITVMNPSGSSVNYALGAHGVPPDWVSFDSTSALVAPHGSVERTLTLRSDAQAVLGSYGFAVSAQASGVESSVLGTLVLDGEPVTADGVARGVVVGLDPSQATAGQGTPALFTLRVTNVGSVSDTYAITVAAPPGFTTTATLTSVEVPVGIGNFRDIQLAVVPPPGTPVGNAGISARATSTADATISAEAPGTVSIVAVGVAVSLSPPAGAPGSTFQMTVRNTGAVMETFDLSLGGPAGVASTLGAPSVTLAPGASQVVSVNVGPINFATPGALNLTGVATARSNTAVKGSATALIAIGETAGITAGFDPALVTLAAPGGAVFLLQVHSTGNREDSYQASIVATSGPISASLSDLEGLPVQNVPLFRIPGLATAALFLDATLQSGGQGTVTVRVQSLTDQSVVAEATATLRSQGANTPPTADAGADQQVAFGTVVVLDGTASHDPDGAPEPLTFAWTFVSTPPGSGLDDAQIAGAATAQPSFEPDVRGDYLLRLTVSDGEASASDEVLVKVVSNAPVAIAGRDRSVATGTPATLDGSDSFDPDGDLLTYEWSFQSVPAGSGLTSETIAGRTAPDPSFIPDVAGAYVLTLVVRDQEATSEPSLVTVRAWAANVPPNAHAGPDRHVALNVSAALDGRASEDPDGGPAPLTFAWTVVAVPAGSQITNGSLSGANQAQAGFVPDVAGDYRIALRVGDGEAFSEDEVLITAHAENVAPNADAGPNVDAVVGVALTLNGWASRDPDRGPAPLTYRWRFVSLPAGSALGNAQIADAEKALAQFTPDVAGPYVLELTVFDGAAGDFDNVLVVARAPGVPTCLGRPATIFVRDGIIVGGPDAGRRFNGILRGTPGPDVIVGTPGDDRIDAGAGDDAICGLGGNDFIQGGAGNDFIDGGPGDDRITGGDGDDVILGGEGNDFIQGGAGNDFIDGGPGHDRIAGGDGDDMLLGGEGNDHIEGGAGNDFIDGGPGDDRITGGDGDDVLLGGEGDDHIDGGAGNDFIDGGAGNDQIAGGDGHDVLLGGEGDDDIDAGAGNDIVQGGSGRDKLQGQAGDDEIDGGPGVDSLDGGPGVDECRDEGSTVKGCER